MAPEEIETLEKAALQRLTADRIQSGSMGPEVESMLAESGIFWDEVAQEYFNLDAYQIETFNRLAQEYASQKDA
jgi:hypothetical protein